MREICIKQLNSSSPEWQTVAEYAAGVSWKAGKSLAQDMLSSGFSDWERVFAAFSGEEIAGFCTLAKTDCIKELAYSPWIGYVFVDEAFRGQRLSQRMLEAAMDYARELRFENVYLISDHEGLYEKYGFEVIGQARAPWGATEKIYRHAL